MAWKSIAGVVDVEILEGREARDAHPTLLVEVPHGADLRHHYDALASRLLGAMPADLHEFFHVNTDVGAWALGRRIAERMLAADPRRSALILRCQLPRTFVDCNRIPSAENGDLTKGGMTAGIPVYVRDDRDRALLLDLHAQYERAAASAFEAVCGPGGLAIVPHTYAPRTVGISAVEDDIVHRLRECWAEPEKWPLRPEIDLITRDPAGASSLAEGLEERLLSAIGAYGFEAKANATYALHPATLGHKFATRYPGRVVTFEARRDLLVPRWTPFDEMIADPGRIDRLAAPFAEVLSSV